MRVEVLPDVEAAARAGAAHVAQTVRAACEARGACHLALSGGRTPWRMLRALADEELPWRALNVFQVDERVAPAGDPDRNLTHLRESLGEAPAQLHPMPVGERDLDAAAAAYARTLSRVAGEPPVLDLVHLGLGDDGHTASLFAGDPALEVEDVDVAVTRPRGGHRRMTLTIPLLARARALLWLVTGDAKAGALSRLRAGDLALPAARVARAAGGPALVLADRAASGAG